MNRFPNNARVCFLGDSITANGRFLALIKEYYRSRFPFTNVRFYDCGTSGGSTEWLLRTFDTDIAPHAPTHMFIMIGINDSRRDLLAQPRSAARYQELKAAYETWQTNLRELVRRCQALGAEVTLLSLPPYAEYQPGDSPALPGAYALTEGYAAATKALAAELGCGFVDVHGHLTKMMQSADLYAEDRVHPTPEGHFQIANIILDSQGLVLSGDPLAAHICSLAAEISAFRSIWAVEYMLIGDDSLTDDARLAFMEKYVAEEGWNKPEYADSLKAYFKEIAENYLIRKPKQAELSAKLEQRLTAAYMTIQTEQREPRQQTPHECIPYREEYGPVTLPEAFLQELAGKSPEEQARCYVWVEQTLLGWMGGKRSFRELAAFCEEHPEMQKYLEPVREHEKLIVRDGIVVGICQRDYAYMEASDSWELTWVHLFPNDRYCYDSDSDNNGAGYKERKWYKYLLCLPADHTFW